MSARSQGQVTLLAFAFVVGACGGGDGDAATETATRPDTSGDVADTTPDVDPNATACCAVGNCADPAMECVTGACVPKRGDDGCYFDGQCQDGKTCQGATFCACGATDCDAIAGHCAYAVGCCAGDGDCGGGEVCERGMCRTTPSGPAGERACWRDGQCGAGEVCEGVIAAPCGANTPSTPGHCGLAGACCASDAECRGGVCAEGRCLERPAAGACWGDGDCGGDDVCLGATVCPCTPGAGSSDRAGGACAVPSTPGRCGERAAACCADDGDCAAGELCVAGECGRAPVRDDNECWVDEHCGLGRTCVGASLCGCNEDGCTDSTIGHCTTDVLACATTADCPVAMHCVDPDQEDCTALGLDNPAGGVCVADGDVGCWQKSDCATDLRCGSEKICLDHEHGCEAENVAGECRDMLKRWDCCDSHKECPAGYECRNQDTSLTCPPTSSAVCLEAPIFGEGCWNVEDCPAGLSCHRVWVCGCNGKCFFNRQGNCEPPSNCQSNSDCGEGFVCALDPECFYSPCTTAATCRSGGQCQEKVEGGCWTHDECGAGNYCEGLKVCPPDTECVLPDQPGICAPRAGLGECCSSFRGCQPGLRCLSPAQRSGCKVDNTSVCVPAVTPGASCYGDEDCDPEQRCEGASICPCGLETCDHPPESGTCVVR